MCMCMYTYMEIWNAEYIEQILGLQDCVTLLSWVALWGVAVSLYLLGLFAEVVPLQYI